jgi:hypothetical protein
MLTLQTSINENIAVDTNIDGHGLYSLHGTKHFMLYLLEYCSFISELVRYSTPFQFSETS